MSQRSTASSGNLQPSTKLRSLPLKETNKLINILNRNNCWKELAGVITHPDHSEELLFTADDISTLEMQWKSGSSPAEALLYHWSTYGKEQPDLLALMKFLKASGLLRAAMEVQNDLLKNCTNEDLLSDDMKTVVNAAQVEDDFTEVDIIAEALTGIDLDGLTVFSYQELQIATKIFSDKRIEEGGCKIGEGAFGSVYRAIISDGIVAVKKLKDPVDKQFITELNILTRFKHENLLPLLGCSFNGPSCCLVYEYMPNGSLQDRLACVIQYIINSTYVRQWLAYSLLLAVVEVPVDGKVKNDSEVIPWSTRLYIAYGSACGINHLHTQGEEPMVHRDIKSANILLDENFVPKVGDFGLVRIGSSSASTTMAVTANVYGTCVYMAREAFNGDVSVKLDTFSFGVVLLELLTALPPYDAHREDRDLITYIQNCDNIYSMLDPKVNWSSEAATELYRISKLCLTETKKLRPTISQVLEDLKNCLLYSSEDN